MLSQLNWSTLPQLRSLHVLETKNGDWDATVPPPPYVAMLIRTRLVQAD